LFFLRDALHATASRNLRSTLGPGRQSDTIGVQNNNSSNVK
jgi:hypothetical protein